MVPVLDNSFIEIFKIPSLLGIYIYQDKGNFVFVNNAFCNFIGYSREELLTKLNLLDILYIKDEEKQKILEIIKKHSEGKIIVREYKELLYKTKDGSVKPAMNFSYTVLYNNKFSGFELVIDITKQKTFELFYRSFIRTNQIALQTKSESAMLNKICLTLNKEIGFDFVVIGKIDKKTNLFNAIFMSGEQEYTKLFRQAKISANEKEKEGQGSIGTAYREKKIVVINNIHTDKRLDIWKRYYEKAGMFSVCSVPLFKNKKVEYILVLYSKIPGIFSKDYMSLIESIQNSISVALEKLDIENWNEVLAQAINSGFDILIITDQQLKIVYANNNAEELLGLKKERLLNNNLIKLISSVDEKITNNLIEILKNLPYNSGASELITFKTSKNKQLRILLNISKIEKNKEKSYYIMAGRDITSNTEIQKAIEFLLRRDDSTGLLNRNAFLEAIEEFIERAKYKRKLIGAIIIINPVNFSVVNEALGIKKGDKLLIEIARRITSSVRKYDAVARFSSTKFGVFLKDIKREEDVLVVAINLLSKLSNSYEIEKEIINLSFCSGISMYPQDSENAEDLVEKAEIALLDAQKRGPDNIGFYREDIKKEAEKKIKIQQEFTKALENREFVFYFQPYFTAKTYKIAGAESLIRWIKKGKIIPPMEFIPFLEETNTITKLEERFIKDMGNDIKEILSYNIPITINLSPPSLKDDDFVDDFLFQISESNIDPNYLNIEITERLFLDNLKKSINTLKKFREFGIKVYVDDFGTGYSSLSYVAQLPVDVIKIDMSFTKKILEDRKTQAVTKTIIYLAEELGLKTIAEGVETKKQLEILEKMGCDYFQGYLFSKPLAKDEFINLIQKNKNHFPNK